MHFVCSIFVWLSSLAKKYHTGHYISYREDGFWIPIQEPRSRFPASCFYLSFSSSIKLIFLFITVWNHNRRIFIRNCGCLDSQRTIKPLSLSHFWQYFNDKARRFCQNFLNYQVCLIVVFTSTILVQEKQYIILAVVILMLSTWQRMECTRPSCRLTCV